MTNLKKKENQRADVLRTALSQTDIQADHLAVEVLAVSSARLAEFTDAMKSLDLDEQLVRIT